MIRPARQNSECLADDDEGEQRRHQNARNAGQGDFGFGDLFLEVRGHVSSPSIPKLYQLHILVGEVFRV